MGLTYHDSKQFLDAVKRNDTLAAELFIAGRGVDLAATDFWGRDAVDFARRNTTSRSLSSSSGVAPQRVERRQRGDRRGLGAQDPRSERGGHEARLD